MMTRHGQGMPADLYFTHTFQQRLQGELRPGRTCGIHYDPLRMQLHPSYVHGDPRQPITVHYQFSEDGPVHEKQLWSRAGIVKRVDVDPTGQGSMLIQELELPEEARELILWFSYRDAEGRVHYDSNHGANYRFRFVTQELELHPVVTAPKDTKDAKDEKSPPAWALSLSVTPEATAAQVRYHVLRNGMAGPRQEASLTATGRRDSQGREVWTLPAIRIPQDGVVIFDVAYQVQGQWQIDDNSGRHYMRRV